MALSDSMSSWWKFDESSGNAADSKGSNTLTNNNSTAYATGKIGNGADLERGSSNYFSVADAASLEPGAEWSIAFWWKPESVADTQELVAKWDDAGNQACFHLFFDPTAGGQLRLTVSANGSSAINKITQNFAFSAGTFYHICITSSAANGFVAYVNATSIATGTAVTLFNGTAEFRVGFTQESGSTSYCDGIIDEMGFWQRELTASEVTFIYNSGTGITYPFGATVSPSVISAVASIPAPTIAGGANFNASVISAVASIQTPTVRGIQQWNNQDKSSAPTWINIDKSA